MSRTLVCTNCFRDTGHDPDFGNLPVEHIIALAENWKCDDCLSEFEREAARAVLKPEGGEHG